MDKKPFEVQLSEAQASLDSSLAAHEVAKRNLNRIRPLAKLKALSQTDLDQAIGDFQTTAAAVSNAKAQVENAKLNLSYCTITSPVTGYASSALQTDGTYINMSNAHLATVYTMSPMWVTFSMSENEEAKINQEVKEGILRRPENHDYEVQLELAGMSSSMLSMQAMVPFCARRSLRARAERVPTKDRSLSAKINTTSTDAGISTDSNK